MGEGFLLALQDSFLELLTPEDEVAVQVERLVDDLVAWLSGSSRRPSRATVQQLQDSLMDLPDHPEKAFLREALSLLTTTLGHSLVPQAWQLVGILRDGAAGLRSRAELRAA